MTTYRNVKTAGLDADIGACRAVIIRRRLALGQPLGDSIVTDLNVLSSSENPWNCPTNSSLLDLAQKMDPEARARVHQLYRPLVQTWCRSPGLQEEETADIVQEVFLAAFKNLGSFRRDKPGYSFRKWLKTIARNEVANHWRRKRKWGNSVGGSEAADVFQNLPAPDATPDGNDAEAESEKKLLLRRMLNVVRAETPTDQWKAFLETTIEGKPAAEVAQALNKTTNFVYLAKSRTLQRFRELYKELVGD